MSVPLPLPPPPPLPLPLPWCGRSGVTWPGLTEWDRPAVVSLQAQTCVSMRGANGNGGLVRGE